MGGTGAGQPGLGEGIVLGQEKLALGTGKQEAAQKEAKRGKGERKGLLLYWVGGWYEECRLMAGAPAPSSLFFQGTVLRMLHQGNRSSKPGASKPVPQ